MNDGFIRGQILWSQQRVDLAEQEFRRAVAEDPQHAAARSFLALCLASRAAFREALDEAQAAIAAAPDAPFPHEAHGRILLAAERPDEAALAAQEALRLEPASESTWALLAAIRLRQRRWPDALEAADRGLAVDPEDEALSNIRATALVQLGRKGEAAETIEGALARDPESSWTHANQGWALLHQGDPKQALVHFREALRLEPTNEWARAGIVEAMKARWWPYGLLLRYFLWVGRLGRRGGAALILGFWVIAQVASRAEFQNPALKKAASVFLVVYVIFVLTSWFGSPFFNLLLRLNRFGRHALSPGQTRQANWFGILAGCGLVCLGVSLLPELGYIRIFAIFFAGLLFPLVSCFECRPGWPKKVMSMWFGAMALFTATMITVWGLALSVGGVFDGIAGRSVDLILPYVWAAVIASWVGQALATVHPRRV